MKTNYKKIRELAAGAKAWLKKHKFRYILFEPAGTGKSNTGRAIIKPIRVIL